ncbi:MAG: class IV adenylate cyclase [Candidatus Lokiarchaeota archaeon]|nr:class IV adenylate cyclase [Candidatus Lokiarchaeota archaeon]
MTSEIEVEMKLPITDIVSLQDKLELLNAQRLGISIQSDMYFNHPCRDFSSTDEAIRIRESIDDADSGKDKTIELTYKGPKLSSGTKTRVETSIELKRMHNASLLLLQLGFKHVQTVKKTRTSYNLNGITLTIDQIDGLGAFVEVEKIVESHEDIPRVEKQLNKLLDKLGLDPSTTIRVSYLEMLLELS